MYKIFGAECGDLQKAMPSQPESSKKSKQALKEVLQTFITYINSQKCGYNQKSMEDTNSVVTSKHKSIIAPSESVNTYISYRKNVDTKLAEINNNISEMLIESFKGIDSICSKVRECVSDFNRQDIQQDLQQEMRSNSAPSHSPVPPDLKSQSDFDVCTTENLLESIHPDSCTSTLSEEDLHSVRESICSIESVGDLLIDETEKIEKRKVNPLLEPDIFEEVNEPDKPKPIIPSFITLVGDGNTNTSNAIQQPKMQIDTNKKLKKKITKRNKQRQLLEHLRESLREDAINTDLQVLETLIENVTKQIDVLSNVSINESPIQSKKTRTRVEEKATAGLGKSVQTTNQQVPSILSPNKHKLFQIPEVYHRPAVTNIHKRLLWQLEANDSFVTFQRLMRKNKEKEKSEKCASPISHINIPILTATPSSSSQRNRRHKIMRPSVKNSKTKVKEEDSGKGNLRCRYTDSLWFDKKLLKEKGQRRYKKELIKTSSKQSTGSKSKPFKKSTTLLNHKLQRPATVCPCSVVVINDGPIPAAINRHQLHSHRIVHQNSRKLAYLDILDDLTNRDLLPINAEYPRKDNICYIPEEKATDIQDSYLYKMMYGANEKNTKIWNHLLQPTIENRDPLGASDHGKRKHENKEETKTTKDEKNRLVDKSTIVNVRKKKVIQTLAPLIFDPQYHEPRKPLIVMPVRIFYGKDQNMITNVSSNLNNQFTKSPSLPRIPVLPLPLQPMKEVKINRAKWTNTTNAPVKKPLKKSGQESPKLTIDEVNDNKSKYNLKTNEQNEYQKKQLEKNEIPKKEIKSKDSPVYDSRKSHINLDKYIKSPQDSIKSNRSNSPNNKLIIGQGKGDFQMKTCTPKFERNVGKKCVTFLKTPPLKTTDKVESATEKYFNVLPSTLKQLEAKTDLKTGESQTEKSSESLFSVSSSATTERHRRMLIHLRGLKQKNFQIQDNIQKAINVIESKMVEILSSPNNANSVEAFDEMEKEITGVLNMMKFSSKCPTKNFERLAPVCEKSLGEEQPNKYEGSSQRLDAQKEYPIDELAEKIMLPETKEGVMDAILEAKEPKMEIIKDDLEAISVDLYMKLEQILKSDKDTSSSDLEKEDITETLKIQDKFRTDPIFLKAPSKEEIIFTSRKTLGRPFPNNMKTHQLVTPKQKMKNSFDGRSNELKKEDNADVEKNSTGSNYGKDRSDVQDYIVKNSNNINSVRNISKIKEKPRDTKGGQNTSAPSTMNFNCSEDSLSFICNEPSKENIFENVKAKSTDEKKSRLNKMMKELVQIPNADTNKILKPLQFPALINTSIVVNTLPETSIDCLEHLNPYPKSNYDIPTMPKSEENIKAEKESVELERPKTATESISKSNRRRPMKERPQTPYKEIQKNQSMSDNKQHVDHSDAGRSSLVNVEDISLMEKSSLHGNIISDQGYKYANNLEDQVHRIISRVEDIYSQLDQIQTSVKEEAPVPIFRESLPKVHQIPSQEFLTPFMQAVKHSRNTVKQLETPSSVTVERSPSYYNILNFLDTLSDIQTEKAIELHTVRSVHRAYIVGIANLIQLSTLEYDTFLTDNNNLKEFEKPSCLKKYSDENKPKLKKVSFVVMHQTESIQPIKLKQLKHVGISSEEFQLTEQFDKEVQEENVRDVSCSQTCGDHMVNTGDNIVDRSNIIILCDKRNTKNVSTDIAFDAEAITNDSSQIIKLDQKYIHDSLQKHFPKKILIDTLIGNSDAMSTSSELTETQSDLSYDTAQSLPKINVFYNDSKKTLPDLFVNDFVDSYDTKCLWKAEHNTTQFIKNQPNVVIFTEVKNTANLIKCPERLRKFEKISPTLMPAPSNELVLKTHTLQNTDNIGLLQSVYAIIYILLFTAFNLEYKCF